MPDMARASRAEVDAGASLGAHGVKERYGVRAVAFPGTVAAGYKDSLRQDFWLDTFTSPYMLFRSSGWLTSRGRPDRADIDEHFHFARTVVDTVRKTLVPQTEPCEREGVRC
jgi:hypothetical protein